MRLAPRAVPAVAALVVAMSASPAQGAEVTFDRSCYAPGDLITQTGSGFTPDGVVNETLTLLDPVTREPIDGSMSAPEVSADAQGAFTRQIGAPGLARVADRRESASSAFADASNPESAPTLVQWTLSAWRVSIEAWERGKAKPGGSMVVDTTGWTADGSTLYAHYFRGSRRVKDVRIGALTGECGNLRKRVRQFPFARVRPGRWTVYFSATARLDRDKDNWLRQTVRV